jgi:hypothetical protein
MSHPNHGRPTPNKATPKASPQKDNAPESPLGIDKKTLYLAVFAVVIGLTIYGYYRDHQAPTTTPAPKALTQPPATE